MKKIATILFSSLWNKITQFFKIFFFNALWSSAHWLYVYPLQHLQSAGPLNYKLRTGLLKLQQEAEILAELLNIAADPDTPVVVQQSEWPVFKFVSFVIFY